MNENFNEKMKDQGSGRESESQSRRVGSLRETLAEVYSQIEIEGYNNPEFAREIALIITEIYRLPPMWEVQIDGQKMPASLVADVYRELTWEHVTAVIAGFKNAEYEIKYRKSYLRTALYNEVFENYSRTVNQLVKSGYRSAVK